MSSSQNSRRRRLTNKPMKLPVAFGASSLSAMRR
jgi:hypothetical protein